MALLLVALRRRLGTICGRELLRSSALIVGASLVAALGAYALAALAAPFGRVFPGLVGGGAFAVLYIVSAHVLRCQELADLSAPLLRRLRR